MNRQFITLLYAFRSVFIGIAVLSCLIIVSALITITGKDTVFAKQTEPDTGISSSDYDTPNVITVSGYYVIDGTNRVMYSLGNALYGASSGITHAASQSGRAFARGTSIALARIGNGTATMARAVGAIATISLQPSGKVLGTAAINPKSVGSLIRPADNTTVPVIDAKTSTEEISRLGEQQQQQIKALLAAQLAANKALAGAEIDGSLRHGGYPARWDNAPQDSLVDSWGMYNRECVSYAAWKVHQTFGSMPYWGGVGNANQWVRNARAAGIPTGRTPQVHSVAISMAGYYGHAMWVEAVNGDTIYVSQYNYGLRGKYSEMWVSGKSFTYIYFR